MEENATWRPELCVPPKTTVNEIPKREGSTTEGTPLGS